MLYSSIRLVTQTELDALELLAHRAMLFVAEAAGAAGNATEASNVALRLPSLTWVVGDFVQRHKEGETAAQWLERLVRGARADGQKHPGLDAVFKAVHCATMWIPSSRGIAGEGLESLPREEWSERFAHDVGVLEQGVRAALAAPEVSLWHGGACTCARASCARVQKNNRFTGSSPLVARNTQVSTCPFLLRSCKRPDPDPSRR